MYLNVVHMFETSYNVRMRSWILNVIAVCALSCNDGNGMCPDGSTCNGNCKAYVVPAGMDLMMPAVSFKNDVLPIFVFSCTFSACHGTMVGQNNGVYLGEHMGTTMTSTVVMGLTKASGELPAMQFVLPGDPSKSFLMHKMDGDQCTMDMQCTGASCGTSMPNGSPLLELVKRDTVRRWIAQGAKDN